MVAVDHFAAPLLIVAAGEWFSQAVAALRCRTRGEALAGSARRGLGFAAGALLGALPELASKWIVHGSPLRSGRLTRFYWDAPRLWDTGFSTQHGLFLWTPLLLASVAGLALLARRAPRVGVPLLASFAAAYYVVACYELWHGSSSYGNRFFVPLTPVFVIGLAALLDAAARSLARLAPAAPPHRPGRPAGVARVVERGADVPVGHGPDPAAGAGGHVAGGAQPGHGRAAAGGWASPCATCARGRTRRAGPGPSSAPQRPVRSHTTMRGQAETSPQWPPNSATCR